MEPYLKKRADSGKLEMSLHQSRTFTSVIQLHRVARGVGAISEVCPIIFWLAEKRMRLWKGPARRSGPCHVGGMIQCPVWLSISSVHRA
jgi:hypothetical protein